MSTELLQYTQNNGNALVPRDYKNNRPLGHWVDKQRSNYKKNNLRPDRIEKLEEIGFVWEPQEVSWSERFNELLDYIKKHGNSLVPQDYEQNVTLGNWVQRQRYKYKTNDLPEERIQQLSEIGFVWDVLQAQWLERLEELKKYRREYGDTLVPRNHLLGSWVWWQRRDYKVFNAKKKLEDGCNNLDASEVERITNSTTGMTEDRIRLLEAEEFIWDPKEYLWELKLEELREWIALNGHGAIVTRKKNNSPLETWATRQRKLFRKYCKGEQTTLTKERIEKLRIVGFDFEIAKS